MLNRYRELDRLEKTIFWLLVFVVIYMVWQIGIRPFWNDPS